MNGVRAVAAALLLCFLCLSATSVLRKSSTWDETHYLGAGRYLLQTGRWDARDTWLHPAFWTVWHDLPLWFAPVPEEVWRETDGTTRGQRIIALRPGDGWLNACRFSLLPFALLLGWVVFAWSRSLHGDAGGLLSLILFCFCPDILAHAPLLTPDITFSCFSVLSAWRLWRLSVEPSRRNLVWCGVALGLMLLSKYTALVLLVALMAADVIARARGGRLDGRSARALWRGLRHWPALLGIACLAVWACYGFRVGRVTLPWGVNIPLPAPAYFRGAIYQFGQSREVHSLFLMGMHSNDGWWYYYLVALLVKLPVGILVLAALRLLAPRRLGPRFSSSESYLLVPFLLLLAYLSLLNRIQNGIRYLLPVYPLGLILLGKCAEGLRRGWAARTAVGLALLWVVAGAVLAWPDYLAYFNELGGGTRQGYHWLGDSNVDWGQDLKALKRYMEAHGIERVRLSYFGTADPAHYGIDYEYLPSPNSALRETPELPSGQSPSPYAAISAYEYQGIDFDAGAGWERLYPYAPEQVIGGSILLFNTDRLVARRDRPLPFRIRALFNRSLSLKQFP